MIQLNTLSSLKFYKLGLISALFFSTSAYAGEPVAVVDDITSDREDVQMLDYLDAGRTITLAQDETLTLGYILSCVQEVITGGTVTIGEEESSIEGGTVERDEVDCDGGSIQLSQAQTQEAGAAVFRGTAGSDNLPSPQRIIFGTSPLIRLSVETGEVTIERLDQETPPLVLTISGRILDLARQNTALEAGGLYKASAGGTALIFKVSRGAEAGHISAVARLLPL